LPLGANKRQTIASGVRLGGVLKIPADGPRQITKSPPEVPKENWMHNAQLSLSQPQHPAYHETREHTVGPALMGFLPAFRDLHTQEIHLSVSGNGKLASVHLLDHLPDHWVIERDELGRITALKEGIVAGFMRQDRFFTRAELARTPCDA
jgi:hypothetical protein